MTQLELAKLLYNISIVLLSWIAVIWIGSFVITQIAPRFFSRTAKNGTGFLYLSFGLVALSILAAHLPYHIAACNLSDELAPLEYFDYVILSATDALRYFPMASDGIPLELEYILLSPDSPCWSFIPFVPEFLRGPKLFQVFDLILLFAAPVCTVSVIFTLLKTFLERFTLSLTIRRKIYYFSALNEKSFTMAKSLYDDWHRWWFIHRADMDIKDHLLLKWITKPRPSLVFCQVDSDDGNETEVLFRADAAALGAVFFSDPIHSIHIVNPRRRKVYIFLIDAEEDANILTLLKMEDKLTHHAFLDPVFAWFDRKKQEKKRLEQQEKDERKEAEEAAKTDVERAADKAAREQKAAEEKANRNKPQEDDRESAAERKRKRKEAKETPRSHIYVFSTYESTELLFDKLLAKLQETNRNRRNYCLHLIDETELIIQKLLVEHPLYEPLMYLPQPEPGQAPDDSHKQISVLAIGGGLLGMELVRGAMICGITDNYKFEIQIIDQNGDNLHHQFNHFNAYLHSRVAGTDAPEKVLPEIITAPDGIGKSIIPKFYQADCQSDEFDTILNDHCKQSNYIVIATGDDELNITTARYLQRWYARQDIQDEMVPSRPPMIFAAIRNSERHEALRSLEDEVTTHNMQKQLFLFGSNEDIFSVDGILSRRLDESAALFNCCYGNGVRLSVTDLCSDPEQRQEALFNLFELPQVTRFSNQIVAMHSLYKLQDLFFVTKTPYMLLHYRHAKARSLQDTKAIFGELAWLIRQRGTAFHQLEHRRWNLFQILDGWETFPMNMVQKCLDAKYTDKPRKPHQLPKIKLHGCLVTFEQLFSLANECKKDPEYFIDFDICMCTASLFAWLDLEAESAHAEIIRNEILEKTRSISTFQRPLYPCDALLDLIIGEYREADFINTERTWQTAAKAAATAAKEAKAQRDARIAEMTRQIIEKRNDIQ